MIFSFFVPVNLLYNYIVSPPIVLIVLARIAICYPTLKRETFSSPEFNFQF
jgi:hypothetical protein